MSIPKPLNTEYNTEYFRKYLISAGFISNIVLKVVTSAKMSVAFLLVGFLSPGNSLLIFDLFSSSSSSSLSSLNLLWIFWAPNIDLELDLKG